MALNNLGLGMTFLGRDQVTPTMKNIGKQFGLLDNSSKKLAKTVGSGFVMMATGAIALGAGLSGVSAAINLANQAGAFEQQLAAVGAISRATTKELAMLEKAAINAGIATQFSPTEATEGLKALSTQGFNATEATQALIPALDLAAGGQISVAQAAMTTASAMRVFGIDAENAALTTDKLLRISNATALQAYDLQLALGTVGRGANLAKQSLDEMLPSIGLVKNTGVDASVAASSVSSALIFMAKNAKKFKGIGVDVTDAQGRFRPFLDIVRETGDALGKKYVSDATRASKAQELFGRFGVSAYTAITGQLSKGIKDATGNVIKNADAINYLRSSMANAGGAAAEFREKLLETYEGQKTLLRGTLQTLGVTFGQPLARVFKPFVSALTNTLNQVIKFFTSLPKPVQTAIAGIFVGVSLLTIALGGLLLVGGAITLLLPYMATFIMVVKVMAIALGGVALAVALFGAAIAGVIWAIRNNIGGLGDGFKAAVAKIKLFWNGLVDLISKGGFSAKVSAEMRKAENQGVRKFAIGIFKVFYRIQRFFRGIAQGFKSAIKFFEPVFSALKEAFSALGDALSDLGVNLLGVSGAPSSAFNAAGKGLGGTLGTLVSGAVFVITNFIRVATVMIRVATTIVKVSKWIWNAFKLVAGFVAETLGPSVRWLSDLWVEGFKSIFEWVKKVTQWFVNNFGTGLDIISEKLSPLIQGFKDLWGVVSKFVGSTVGKAVTSWLEMGLDTNTTTRRGLRPAAATAGVVAPTAPRVAGVGQAPVAAQVSYAEAAKAAAARGESAEDFRANWQNVLKTMEKRPINVALNIDGARVGEAVATADRGRKARRGIPVAEEAY